MSLILEALNRAEQQRQDQNQVPSIHSVHPLAPPSLQPAKPRRLMVWWLLCLLVVALGGAGWWLVWPKKEAPALAEALSPITVPSPIAALSPITAPVPAAAPVTVPVTVHGEAVQHSAKVDVDALPTDPTSVAPAASTDVAALDVPAAPSQASTQIDQLYAASENPAVAQIEQLYQPEAAAPLSQAVVAPFEVERPAVAQLPSRYLASIEGVPLFDDLAWSQKLTVPTISYSRHDYLPSDISTVVINGEIRSVGNVISAGQLLVEDILADGVVLRHGALRFKLKALNGWVNM